VKTRSLSTEEAYARLRAHLRLSQVSLTPKAWGEVREAWAALDRGLAAGEEFPVAWQRLTSGQAAERAGRTQGSWANLVSQGYAPPQDGFDSLGRKYWCASTVDDFIAHGYRAPRPR